MLTSRCSGSFSSSHEHSSRSEDSELVGQSNLLSSGNNSMGTRNNPVEYWQGKCGQILWVPHLERAKLLCSFGSQAEADAAAGQFLDVVPVEQLLR